MYRGFPWENNEEKSKKDSESISLKVSKAIPSDVGHGRARISGDNDLDLKPGDIIEIKGDNHRRLGIAHK